MNKGKEVAHDSRTMGVIEVITEGFPRGDLSNNAHKRLVRVVMAVESKKVKPQEVEKSAVISFSDEDYPDGLDLDHDNLMVIITTIHNYAIKRILVD